MKKKLLFVVAAVLALGSCSSDETIVSKPDADVISFRPLVNGVMRTANGAGLKTAWETDDKLYVFAEYNSGKLLQAEFTKDATGFNSTNKYYWPNDVSNTKPVTFTAFWGAAQKTYSSSGDENQLSTTYTVDDDVDNQMDLLFAKKKMEAKPTGGAGVVLNFRHMLSQIAVKVANDQPNLKITISGVRIGFLNKKGTFTYNTTKSGSTTDTHVADATNTAGATLIDKDDWTKTDNSDKKASYYYDQTLSATLPGATAQNLTTKSWILMPQVLTAATGYNTSGDDDEKLNGAYIALKMAINDKDTNAEIAPEQWCCWPIGTTWKPGYRYTYTINAGSGGYMETDPDDDGEFNPVLGQAVIWFMPTCTIDEWVDENYGLSTPIARTASCAFGSNQIISLDPGANGTYTITISGLTESHHVTASATGNFTSSPTVSDAGVVPASGIVTITGTLSANTTAAASSVITITHDNGTDSDTSDDQSMTITINQAAPAAPAPAP